MEQLVARRAHNPKVIGSSPVPATKDDSSVLIGGSFFMGVLEYLRITFHTTGYFAVELTSTDACGGVQVDTSTCNLVDFTGIGELNNTPKQLIKIVDVLGRETPFKPNTPLLYIYNDGTVERKVVLK